MRETAQGFGKVPGKVSKQGYRSRTGGTLRQVPARFRSYIGVISDKLHVASGEV